MRTLASQYAPSSVPDKGKRGKDPEGDKGKGKGAAKGSSMFDELIRATGGYGSLHKMVTGFCYYF